MFESPALTHVSHDVVFFYDGRFDDVHDVVR